MMQMVNLTIDGKQIQAPAGSSVLEAARSAGIYIPTLSSGPASGGCLPLVYGRGQRCAYSGCFLRISCKRRYGSKN